MVEDITDEINKRVLERIINNKKKISDWIIDIIKILYMTNIAEILKDCPKGTKLYSPICGECYLYWVADGIKNMECRMEVDGKIVVYDNDRSKYSFYQDGTQHKMGECLLFPSKENRDWSAFGFANRFRKGDFIHNRDWICIYYGVKDNGAIQFFAFIPWDWDRNTSTERYDVRPTEKPKIGIGYINNETRLATEDEKTLLLSAIEYKGYVWDAEKLELRNKEPEFKPFDKVLVRDEIDVVWKLAQYAFEDKGTEYKYNTVGGEYWQYCIPYEGNEHLLGTTENCE